MPIGRLMGGLSIAGLLGTPVAAGLMEEPEPIGVPAPVFAADVAEDSPTDPPPDLGPEALVICSWNIKSFGKKTDPGERRLDWIAEFLRQCDVVAIQEVTGANYKWAMSALRAELDDHGTNFRYRISPPTGHVDNPDDDKGDYTERFAFLWNDERVRLRGAPHFLSTPPINHPEFRQVPWVASFQARAAGHVDFHVASVHVAFNEKLRDVMEVETRRIRDWVSDAETRAEKHAIALGDFNANADGVMGHFKTLLPPSGTEVIVPLYEPVSVGEASVRTTVPTKDIEAGDTRFHGPVYDHVLLSPSFAALLLAQPFTFSSDLVGVWRFDDEPEWALADCDRNCRRKNVSDHRPIWFAMDFNALDAD